MRLKEKNILFVKTIQEDSTVDNDRNWAKDLCIWNYYYRGLFYVYTLSYSQYFLSVDIHYWKLDFEIFVSHSLNGDGYDLTDACECCPLC